MRPRPERERQEHAAPRGRRARARRDRARVRGTASTSPRVPPHRRGFGLMFQDHALFPHRDVLGNVAFGLRMQRLAARRDRHAHARRARARRARRLRAPARPRALGRRAAARRARPRARARAAAADARRAARRARPRAPRAARRRAARAVRRGSGSPTLFVTHDHDEAFALADRVVVMHAGRIEQVGTPATVWHRPANAFVARFLGWNVTRAFSATAWPRSGPRPIRVVDGRAGHRRR